MQFTNFIKFLLICIIIIIIIFLNYSEGFAYENISFDTPINENNTINQNEVVIHIILSNSISQNDTAKLATKFNSFKGKTITLQNDLLKNKIIKNVIVTRKCLGKQCPQLFFQIKNKKIKCNNLISNYNNVYSNLMNYLSLK